MCLIIISLLIIVSCIYFYKCRSKAKHKLKFNKLSNVKNVNYNSIEAVGLKLNGIDSQLLIDSPELLYLSNLDINYTPAQMEELIENVKKEIQDSQLNIANERYIPLCVAFADKDLVKSLGAIWNFEIKTWFANFKDLDLFTQWLPAIYKREEICILPNLVPKELWGINLRSAIDKDEWNLIKRKINSNNGYRCLICGCKGKKWPVECHEDWEYTTHANKNHAKLKQLKSICSNCHNVIHYGRAQEYNQHPMAVARLIVLNNWSLEKVDIEIMAAFNTWDCLSKIKNWSVDISILNDDKYNFIHGN